VTVLVNGDHDSGTLQTL